ncbi:hypothetical protein KI387_027600, partial [Taxus chinensis]
MGCSVGVDGGLQGGKQLEGEKELVYMYEEPKQATEEQRTKNDSKAKNDDYEEYQWAKRHARGGGDSADAKHNNIGPGNGNTASSFNGAQQGPTVVASKESSNDLPIPIAISEFSADKKVSTVFTTNVVENKADNIARSRE